MDTGGHHRGNGPIVRTVKSRGGVDYSNYEGAVAVIDCAPFWRKFGLKWRDCQTLWFVKDACGVVCAVFTWLLVLYADYVVFFVMLYAAPNQIHSIINGVIFQFFSFLALASHTKAMLSDPVSLGLLASDN